MSTGEEPPLEEDRYAASALWGRAPEPGPSPTEIAWRLLDPDPVLDRLIFAADSGSVPQENLVTLGKEADAQGLHSTQPPRPDRVLADFECTLAVELAHIEAWHLIRLRPTILPSTAVSAHV